MKICSLASGSAGNSIFIESNQSKILIDAGHSGKQIEILLNLIGEKASDLDGIFVTHEHSDHIKGVGVLSRRYDLPIIANEKTWMAMSKKIGNIAMKNIRVFKSNTFFSFRDLDIHAFSTHHDAVDPVAYVFYQEGQKITVLTDTGIITESMKDHIIESDIYFIESNHDIEMLKKGSYPYRLKERILSNQGHLSNCSSSDIVSELVRGNREIVILGHLSSENNVEIKAQNQLVNQLDMKGLDVEKDISILVAPKLKPGIIQDLGGNYKK